MANEADEFLKKLEAGDIMFYELPPGERKRIVKVLASPENRKEALDRLVAAAKVKLIDARESAVDIIDIIGDADAIKRVAEFWMPFLDMEYGNKVIGGVPAFDESEQFNKRQAVEVFERMHWPPAADHQALFIENGGLNHMDFIQLGAILNLMEKSGRKENEKPVLDAAKNAMRGDLDETSIFFGALGALGSKDSKAFLEEYREKYKNSSDPYVKGDLKEARDAIKRIEKREGVSIKPAEEKLKEGMKREKVKTT